MKNLNINWKKLTAVVLSGVVLASGFATGYKIGEYKGKNEEDNSNEYSYNNMNNQFEVFLNNSRYSDSYRVDDYDRLMLEYDIARNANDVDKCKNILYQMNTLVIGEKILNELEYNPEDVLRFVIDGPDAFLRIQKDSEEKSVYLRLPKNIYTAYTFEINTIEQCDNELSKTIDLMDSEVEISEKIIDNHFSKRSDLSYVVKINNKVFKK